jgi:hypothetical protein
MNLYIAGLYTANFERGGNGWAKLDDREKVGHASVENFLESWHYIGHGRYAQRIRENSQRVFLDSGAFSAFSLGVSVDLPAYVRWISENLDIIRVEDGSLMASVLDGIGDPLKTYQNQCEMERLGVRPLPCFHYGEDERYLEWYIANYEYITIGGMVPISTPQLFHWLDRIWNKYLTDGSGRARIKVHGFGLTSRDLMTRYPWHSTDSSSWVQIGAHGNIMMEGKTLGFSSQSPSRKTVNQHIDSMAPIMREAIEQKLTGMGYDPDRLREIQYSRWAFNAEQFANMGRDLKAQGIKFDHQQPELFS